MQRGTLKNIRLVMPAIIIAALFFLLSQMLGFTKVKMPSNLKDALYNVPLVVIGVVYAYSPFRDLANRKFVPFHEFRNWLAEIRNDPTRRWKRRRNGTIGAGAFNLQAREEILGRLRELETRTGTTIIAPDEAAEIHKLWELDRELDEKMNAAA